MFSNPLYQVSGSGFKKGTFWDVLGPWEPCPGMPVEWLLVSEGPGLPSLLSPLSFKLTFWVILLRSFRQSFMRWSGLPTTTSETILIIPLMQLDCVDKMDNIPNQLICSSSSTQRFCIFSSWRLGLLFPFQLCAQVLLSFVAFHCSGLSSGGMIALQLKLMGGKQIPWCLRTSYIQSSSCGSLQE